MTAVGRTRRHVTERGVVSGVEPFVPRLALDLADNGSPSWTSLDGSMLSADISGFTALSERLARKGKAGAEEITGLINACFTALIDAAYRFDGEVVKFGGDALLIVFRGTNHERRAADAGLAMQRALVASSAAKRASLSMTVGVAAGPFDAFVVGSSYRELLITGRRASEVIRLEAAAEQGETLVSPSIAAALPASMIVAERDGGVVVVGATGDPDSTIAARSTPPDSISEWVPDAVVAQLAGFETLGGEHRLVTVGFVMITGVASEIDRTGPDATSVALSAVVDRVVETCDRFSVTLLHSDIATDGVKLVLCAGAPLTQGDTSDAMLRSALRIARTESPFVIRQGVQTGRVFAGFLGSEHRRTYTLMGDPVNTAARMLGQSGDREVVAVDNVVDHTRTVFRTEELEPFFVKGKTQPIVAHKVLRATGQMRRPAFASRLIGRDHEVRLLREAVDENGRVVELVGVAGVGKSRLLDAMFDHAKNVVVYQGVCTPYGVGTPYSVIRPLLRGGTGLADDLGAEATGVRLTEIVSAVAPHLLPMLPLLAVPFGARVAPTDEVDAIEPEFRRVRIREVVVSFLDATLVGSTLLIVEDAHWIDEASADLFDHLVRSCAGRRWSGVVTRRPEGTWQVDTVADHVRSLELHPLDDAAIRGLAVEMSTRPLTDRALDQFVERAQGNPLFAIELARALMDDPSELPGSVEQIIASRLDRLEPSARRWVRVASVLGNQFDETVVSAMLDDESRTIDTAAALAASAAAETVEHRWGTTWAFNHALYRDTAYAGLPFSLRRRLHRDAATIIEERSADLSAAAPVLSLHYAAARSYEQAWQYSLIAGEAAEAQHADADAVIAYERALAAGRRAPDVTPAQRSSVAQRLGDLAYELGQFERAATAFRFARRNNDDPVREVALIRKIGSVCERQGRPDRAIRWYQRAARAVPRDAADREWAVARADVALAEAGIRHRMGDNSRCLDLAMDALANARDAADHRIEALALERIHLALTYLRRPDADGEGFAALDAYRRLEDRSGMARTLINLGIEAYFAGRLSDASAFYLEALDTAQRAGNVVLAATAAINGAEVLSDQGDWVSAIELFENARRNYEAVGYGAGIAASGFFAGVAAMRSGDHDAAIAWFDGARGPLDRLGMGEMVDDLDAHRFELDVFTGAATIESANVLVTRFGEGHPVDARVRRARALLLHRLGDDGEASAALLDTLSRHRDGTLPAGFELAQTLEACAVLAATDEAEAAAWRSEAASIFDRLGVITPPPLPT